MTSQIARSDANNVAVNNGASLLVHQTHTVCQSRAAIAEWTIAPPSGSSLDATGARDRPVRASAPTQPCDAARHASSTRPIDGHGLVRAARLGCLVIVGRPQSPDRHALARCELQTEMLCRYRRAVWRSRSGSGNLAVDPNARLARSDEQLQEPAKASRILARLNVAEVRPHRPSISLNLAHPQAMECGEKRMRPCENPAVSPPPPPSLLEGPLRIRGDKVVPLRRYSTVAG